MLKSSVGYSTSNDYFLAGMDSANDSISKLDEPKVSFLFTSCKSDIKQVVKGIRSVSDTPIIGCTSSGGIIVPDGVITSDDGFTGLLTLSDEQIERITKWIRLIHICILIVYLFQNIILV